MNPRRARLARPLVSIALVAAVSLLGAAASSGGRDGAGGAVLLAPTQALAAALKKTYMGGHYRADQIFGPVRDLYWGRYRGSEYALADFKGEAGAVVQGGPFLFSRSRGGAWRLRSGTGGRICPGVIPKPMLAAWNVLAPGCGGRAPKLAVVDPQQNPSVLLKPERITLRDYTELFRLAWSSWGGPAATAIGLLAFDDCKPNCFAGRFTSYPVTVHIRGRGRCPGVKADVYTLLTYTVTGPRAPRIGRIGRADLLAGGGC